MSYRGFPSIAKKMKKILAFGNPLLDRSITIKDNFLLEKYTLKEDGQKEITDNEMKTLFRDIQGYKQETSAGGCAQNSLRVLQWLLKKQCTAVIYGSVGKDNEADVLKRLLANEGVQTRYVEQKDLPTGRTVVLVRGSKRSLLAHIGAAEKFPLSDLLAQQNFPNDVKESDFIYIEGFFLTKRTETAKYILDVCNALNKTTIFNICGEYVCEGYPETVKYFVENVDIIFGNRAEFKALSKIMGFETISELTQDLVSKGKNKLPRYGNIIVITDGAETIRCIYKSGKNINIDVPHVDQNDIVDTTGAGDAFIGGFIVGLLKNKSVRGCAHIGCYAASHILKQTGCTLPSFQPTIIDL